jgi:hypothetical protein
MMENSLPKYQVTRNISRMFNVLCCECVYCSKSKLKLDHARYSEIKKTENDPSRYLFLNILVALQQ